MRRTKLVVIGLASTAVLTLFSAAPAGATVTVTEWGTPSANSGPNGITVGKDGNLYFTETAAGNTGELTPSAGIPAFGTEVPLPSGDRPGPMVTGHDGNLWFVDGGTHEIGRISTAGTGLQEFPTGEPSTDLPYDIAAGPDGNLWFTVLGPTNSAGFIGRMSTSGSVTDFSITPPAQCPTGSTVTPYGITSGPDGNVWFTAESCLGGSIGQITPSGTSTVFPTADPASNAVSITSGPNGNLWIAGNNDADFQEMNTSGTVTGWFMKMPVSSHPVAIAEDGCDGDLWATDVGTGTVDRVTTGGTISQYPVASGFKGYSGPHSIVWGPFGMWFTDFQAGDIGRVVDSGSFLCTSMIATGSWVRPNMRGHLRSKVGWLMADPQGMHGAADTSGLELFGYGGPAGPLPYSYGADPTFTFDWAGTFGYDDPFMPAARGNVSIPPTATLVAGTTDEANVTWAAADAPAGDAFDVQVEVPGSSTFVNWQNGVSSLSAAFGPPDPLWAGPGTYHFRARLIQSSTGAAVAYSPAVSISL